MRFAVLIYAMPVLAAACAAAPSIGSAALSNQPNLHLAADPYAVIAAQLAVSPLAAPCPAPPLQGPAANLDSSLIPADEYQQQRRRAQALTAPYRFTIRLSAGASAGQYLQVLAPAGFVTDFHSMPSAAETGLPAARRALEAAVIHDWLYAIGQPGDERQRALADQAYSDILAFYQVDSLSRQTLASAVRFGGRKAFGAPDELRFYNTCFYGLCRAMPGAALRELTASPVLPLAADPGLRRRLWDLTVCLSPPGQPLQSALR